MSDPKPQKKSGLLGNLAFNIIIPVVILTNLSSDEYLGPAWSIVAALIFPIGFGIWDLKQTSKINPFSVLGIVSVFLTGGISLLELPAEYIAIKEATIPAIIGIAVLITQRTSKPLLKVFVLSEQIINWENLNQSLENSGASNEFEKKMAISSYIVAASFFLSAALNYILAKVILVSPPGTTEYTEELGRMTALSYPVIVIPSMLMLIAALWYIFAQIKKLTGEDLDHFLADV
ncbi:VC0807 family protein [Paraglaciecola arctica]|uniref:Dihydroorotate dehydrogenase 2 n=1 Tax=Paraglaciecola arctica BSs20135 TaxID=493475 RepID=K6ZEX8_9ALTE|nr:VC0807 family protein [Paraglaciecola arctica]GAC21965.1 dihydroorotate dehydrogenase 2 [Paraglaciecola arctica BSs20135]